MIEKPSVIFMGTPEFSVPTMIRLHEEFGLKAVVTTPDRRKGRGKKLLPSAVKIEAKKLGLPILQPEKLKDPNFIEELKSFEPQVMCVLAFRILPVEVFEISKIATFNVHASLLPKYRGAAPINWAIINGEKETGLTSFVLAKKVDTGSILMQKTVEIPEGFTAGDLHDKLMIESAPFAADTTRILLGGDFKTYAQDHSQATPAPKIFPDFCQINWDGHARDIRNFIHGVSPVPGAWTILDGVRHKILRAEFCACGRGEPGTFEVNNGNLIVKCRKGYLSILEIQPAGKKPMKIADFVRGYRGSNPGKFENKTEPKQ